MSITLTQEQVEDIKAALDLSDKLVTMVISGTTGQQRAALTLGGLLSALKRARHLSSGK